jgi:hypothetical protein
LFFFCWFFFANLFVPDPFFVSYDREQVSDSLDCTFWPND